jgi:hypothetical protein
MELRYVTVKDILLFLCSDLMFLCKNILDAGSVAAFVCTEIECTYTVLVH